MNTPRISGRRLVTRRLAPAVALGLGFAVSGGGLSLAASHAHHPKKHHKQRPICRRHQRPPGCIPVPKGVGAPHKNQNAPGGPKFVVAPPADGLGATSAGEQGAIDWAWTRMGSQAFDGWCGKFVAYAFNMPALGYATAWQAAVAFGLHPGQAPPGALVFFRPTFSNGYAGHIGIALTNNRMISAQSNGVHVADLGQAYWRALYAGWAYPPSNWPGRAPTGAAPPQFPPGPAPAPPTPPAPTQTTPASNTTTTPPTTTGTTPPPPPAPTFYVHHVYGTCRDGACGLKVHTAPHLSAPVTHVISDGTEVDVVCQAIGDTVSNGHASSAIWDRQTDGSWVSDFYIDTPNVGTWSPPIPQC